jgi:hypothetical protein
MRGKPKKMNEERREKILTKFIGDVCVFIKAL